MYGVDYIALVSCIYYAFHHIWKAVNYSPRLKIIQCNKAKDGCKMSCIFFIWNWLLCRWFALCWKNLGKFPEKPLNICWFWIFCWHSVSIYIFIAFPINDLNFTCWMLNPKSNGDNCFNCNKMDPLKIFLKAWFNRNS